MEEALIGQVLAGEVRLEQRVGLSECRMVVQQTIDAHDDWKIFKVNVKSEKNHFKALDFTLDIFTHLLALYT